MLNILQVSYRDPNAGALFTKSILETGFAVIKDHPISQGLVKETYQEWERFFDSNRKLDYTFDPKLQSGYFPFKSEKAKNYSVKDLKEFYHYYSWGMVPEGFSPGTVLLFKELTKLGIELLSWIEDHTPNEVRSKFSIPLREMVQDSRETLLRIIHYPPLNGDEEQGAIRAAEHEDINLITLLPAGTAPGLQVKDTLGQWHDVACDLGSIAINAGDMLKMASGGYYQSTPHRVVNPMGELSKTSRYSMPLFLHPRANVRLSDKHTAGSYLKERLGEIGLL